jgi:hypothetical protein
VSVDIGAPSGAATNRYDRHRHFVVQVVTCAASFCAHVFFDKEDDVEGSRLRRDSEGRSSSRAVTLSGR